MAVATKTVSRNGQSAKATSTKVNGSPSQSNGKIISDEKIMTPINVEDRVKKINRVGELAKQRARLIERKDEAEEFDFGSDKMQDRLLITDGNQNSFTTTNSGLIAKVNAALIEVLDEAIQQVEQEIIETKF